MNKRKRIIALENRVDVLEQAKKNLETHIEVLDFKEKAKGEKFVIKQVNVGGLFSPFQRSCTRVSYLSESGNSVKTEDFENCHDTVTQNEKYLEFWHDKKIVRAMRVYNDRLVEMDVDVYSKAYADRIAEKRKPLIDINACTSAASDALAKVSGSVSDWARRVAKLF